MLKTIDAESGTAVVMEVGDRRGESDHQYGAYP